MIFFDILWPIVAKKIYPSMLKLNATDFCHILLGIQNINPKLRATYSQLVLPL